MAADRIGSQVQKAVDLMTLTSNVAEWFERQCGRTASAASARCAGSDLAERGVADLLPRAIRAIATIERCNDNKGRILLGSRRKFWYLAERQGFEPWIEFPLYTLSKRAPSATRPSLRSQF